MEKNSPCFVITISLDKRKKLEQDLKDQGFALTHPTNALFQAQKTGVSCTLYASGKLTVQGKDKHDFITFYLEPEIMGSLNYSNPEVYGDLRSRIGIDEAGKGDFFGPLCVAGVQVEASRFKELLDLGVKDSKKLNDPLILKIAYKIREKFPHSIVKISPKRYNEMYESFKNLNALLAWGHATAIEDLAKKTGCQLAVIDQFASESVVIRALAQKKLTLTLEQRHHGEEDPVVAAASILARAAFVEGMDQLSQRYGMEIPKGASEAVIRAGKKLVAKFGREILFETAKTHFKTLSQVLGAE